MKRVLFFVTAPIRALIALPEPVKAGLLAVILYVASFFIAHLIALVPFLAFLTEFIAPLAAGVAMALIAWIEKAVPDVYDKVAVAALQLILAILAVFGIGNTLAAMGALPALLALARVLAGVSRPLEAVREPYPETQAGG